MTVSPTRVECGAPAQVTIRHIPQYWWGRPVRLTRAGPNLAPQGWTGATLAVDLPAVSEPGRMPVLVGLDVAGEIEFFSKSSEPS